METRREKLGTMSTKDEGKERVKKKKKKPVWQAQN